MAEALSPNPMVGGQKQRFPMAARIQSPTSPFFLGSNDDQRECAQARAARATAIRCKNVAVNLHSQSADSNSDPCFNKQQILDLFQNGISLLGSCNGLLCICNVAEDIAFWNPWLRKHRILPYLPTARRPVPDTSFFAARVYGFGCDSSSDDYKLIRILYFVDLHNRTFDSEVRLYSSRTNAWKTLPRMPYALCYARTMGVFVDGNLHWVVTRKLEPGQPDLIVAFDLRSEIFWEVPLPEKGHDDVNVEIDVTLLGGCLCMIVNFDEKRIDVWVMKKYGNKDSWCKLFVLVESCDLRSLKSVRPLGYSRDGFKVLLEHNRTKLFWYDLKNEEITDVRIPGMPELTEGMIFVGSLVPSSLLGENCSKHHRWKLQNTRKRRDDFLSQGFKLTL